MRYIEYSGAIYGRFDKEGDREFFYKLNKYGEKSGTDRFTIFWVLEKLFTKEAKIYENPQFKSTSNVEFYYNGNNVFFSNPDIEGEKGFINKNKIESCGIPTDIVLRNSTQITDLKLLKRLREVYKAFTTAVTSIVSKEK